MNHEPLTGATITDVQIEALSDEDAVEQDLGSYANLNELKATALLPFFDGGVVQAKARSRCAALYNDAHRHGNAFDSTNALRIAEEEAPRLRELALRLCAPGPKASHVSASETHEITNGLLELLDVLPTAARRVHELEKLLKAMTRDRDEALDGRQTIDADRTELTRGNTELGAECARLQTECGRLQTDVARHTERNRKALDLLGIKYPGLCNDRVWGGGIIKGIEELQRERDAYRAALADLVAARGVDAYDRAYSTARELLKSSVAPGETA
jgi:hypothetical protein